MARGRKIASGTAVRTAGGRHRPGAGRKRSPAAAETSARVTVGLSSRQTAFLDRVAANILEQSGSSVTRSQLIRALLEAASGADLELTASRSVADLKATLIARLGRYRLGG
jgi:hypothetical protein